MKEERYFYVPQAAAMNELPEEETTHALRVLRLKEGDEMMLMDGQGTFFRAAVTMTSGKHCFYQILQTLPQQPTWQGHLHLAIAPTKMMERIEWLAEKATEVGFDELSLLDCRFSERHVVKMPRLDKIVISAMKQSRKAWKPVVNEMQDFKTFISQHTTGRRYIAHCYDEVPRVNLFEELKTHPQPLPAGRGDITLEADSSGLTTLEADSSRLIVSEADSPGLPGICPPPCMEGTGEGLLVLIGPEGDFSIDEVRMAVDAGFVSVDLGKSRLRTETAGLATVMMMQLSQQ
jgi:16S rRNA (uracil1498-N3)-methyltransferase